MSDLVRKLPIQYTHPDGVDVNGGGGGGNSSSPQNNYVRSSDLANIAFTGKIESLDSFPIAMITDEERSYNNLWYNRIKFLRIYDLSSSITFILINALTSTGRGQWLFYEGDDPNYGGDIYWGRNNGAVGRISICTYDPDAKTFTCRNLNYDTITSNLPTIPSWIGNSKPTYRWDEITEKPTINRTAKLEEYVSYAARMANTFAPGLYVAQNIDTSEYNVLLCSSNMSLADEQYMAQRYAIRVVYAGGNQSNMNIDYSSEVIEDFELLRGVYLYKIVNNIVYIKTIEEVLKEYYKGALFANTVLSRVIYVDAAEWNEIQLDIDTFKDSNNRVHTKGHHLIYFEKDTKYHKYNSVPGIQIKISGTTYFLNYKMNSFTFNTSSEKIKAGLYEFSIDATDVILKPYGLTNVPHSIINNSSSANFEYDYYFDDIIKLSNSNITLGTTKIREGKEIKVYSTDATSTCNGVVIGENEYKEFTFIDNAWRLRT